MEFTGFFEGWLIAAAFFGDDMKDDRFVLALEVIEGSSEEIKVVSIDGAEVTKAKFFKQNVGEEEVFGGTFDFTGDFSHGFAAYFLYEVRCFVANCRVGGMSLKSVKVFGDRSDIFVDRPFVVVEDLSLIHI